MANSLDPDQTAPIGAVCSGSTLFASIPNSSVKLGNYLQQTTVGKQHRRRTACASAQSDQRLFYSHFIKYNI